MPSDHKLRAPVDSSVAFFFFSEVASSYGCRNLPGSWEGGHATEGPSWGDPRFIFGANSSFLEPFSGLLSPKVVKISQHRLLIEVRRAWRGSVSAKQRLGGTSTGSRQLLTHKLTCWAVTCHKLTCDSRVGMRGVWHQSENPLPSEEGTT